MRLRTRLTERLAIKHPVLSAPMGMVAGGRLAAAVTRTGGFGMIGGGYGDASWLEQEFAAAGDARVGCGFITWSLARKPELLDLTLGRNPVAVMLSFGAPEPFAAKIRDSGALLICQVQSLAAARRAVEARADILVAQGGRRAVTAATARLSRSCPRSLISLRAYRPTRCSSPLAGLPTAGAWQPR